MHHRPRNSAVRTLVSVAALFAAASAALSGCSAESGANTTPTAKAFSEDDAIATTSRLVASVKADPGLEAKRGSRFDSIAVGSSLFAPPTAYLKGSDAVGYEPDLIRAIGKKLGAKTTVENAPFPTLITGLQAGRYNLIISGMSDTAERRKIIDFVDYGTDYLAFLVQKGNPEKISDDAASLCGKTVDGLQGSQQLTWAKGVSDSVCSSDKAIKIVAVPDAPTALNDIRTGRAAVFLSDSTNAPYTAATARGGNSLEAIIPHPAVNALPLGIAVDKSNPGLRDAVAGALQQLMEDGTYKKILQAWQVQSTAIDKATINAGN